MGNKVGSNWEIVSISHEGKVGWMAEAGHINVAKADFEETLKHRPGRTVQFRHRVLILRREIGPPKTEGC